MSDQALLDRLITHLDRVVLAANHLLPEGERWRTGGRLAFSHKHQEGEYGATVGPLLTSEKEVRYSTFAKEKARRLCAHPEHRTSRESRDPEKAQFGGAIRAGEYILSFSGFPEAWDEALLLHAAYHQGLLTLNEVQAIGNREVLLIFAELSALER